MNLYKTSALAFAVLLNLAASAPAESAAAGTRTHTELKSAAPDNEVLTTDSDGDGAPDILERWWHGKRVRWLNESGAMRRGDLRGDGVNDVLQADMDGDGSYDGPTDMNIKWCDTDGDGIPDVQAIAVNPKTWGPTKAEQTGHPVWMVFINHDKHGVLGWIDWEKFNFHCWDFTGMCNWLPNYHGNSDFVKTHVPPWALADARLNWENPFSFYDETGDGTSKMAMRWCAPQPNNKGRVDIPPAVNVAYVTYDLDGNSGYGNETSYDMTLEAGGMDIDITNMKHPLPHFKGNPKFDCCFNHNEWRRIDELIYMDRNKGYGAFFNTKWKFVNMVFDEDGDDHRWERVEMMSSSANRKPGGPPVDLYSTARYDNTEGKTPGLDALFQSDSLGDRGEFDRDGSGGGKLYIGPFDRKLHLYGAESGAWTVDKNAGFHGGAGEPTKRPTAPKVEEVVKYTDTDRDGFIDTIEYDYTGSRHIDLKVCLLDYKTSESDPQKADLIEPGRLGWKGMHETFNKMAEDSWIEALSVYRAAWKRDLTTPELDKLAASSSLRQRYMNAYWIKEKIFRQIRRNAIARMEAHPGETTHLEKFLSDYIRAYYTGRFDTVVELIAQAPPFYLFSAHAQRGQPQIELQAEPFDMSEVRLLESPFQRAQDTTRDLLLNIDSDRLLYPFRREAGIPSPVKGTDSYFYAHTGHSLGHFLSACAQLYQNTGDAEVKMKADALVAALGECQAKMGNGYLGGFPEKAILHLEGLIKDPQAKADVPWYCLHKVYAGLLDMYALAGNQQALDVLRKAADWADRNLSQLTDAQVQNMLTTEHGGMTEVLANLSSITGEEKYLRLSLRFNHREFLEPFAKGEDPMDARHANTQIPKFIGPARQYILTGNSTQKESAARFWNAVVQDRSYVTGGNSLYEHFSPKGALSHFVNGWTSETCNEYNMLKLTRSLYGADPKPGYMDYYERTLYNHILSSRQPGTGGQLYFQVLQTGHFKGEPGGIPGWRYVFNQGAGAASCGAETACCSGSGLESNTKYGDTIYFHQGEKKLYINLFIPSVLEWKSNGLTLKQETRYPEEGKSQFTFSCKKPVALKVLIRRPWWATKEFQVLVNGRKQEITSTPDSYVQVERTWENGDTMEVIMPMTFRMEGFADNPKRAAIMYGPLVMAGITAHGNPFSVICTSDDHFLETLKPVDGRPLEFTAPAEIFRTSPFAISEKPVTFRPLYSTFGDSCAIYWDIVDPANFQAMSASMKSELERLKLLEPRTVDAVLCEGSTGGTLGKGSMFTFRTHYLNDEKWLPRPAREFSEKAHGVKSSEVKVLRNSYAEVFHSEMMFGLLGDFRMLEPGKFCSYQMKVLPEAPQELQVRIWKPAHAGSGSPLKQGVLEVLIDEKQLGSCDVDTLPAGQFTGVGFPLPAELLKAKSSVEVVLRVPEKSQAVFGIYECRIVTHGQDAQPTGATR